MIAIRSNGTATPGKTAGKNLGGNAINAVNTVSYGRNAVFTVDGYNLLTSQFAISGSNSVGDLWGYIWGYLRNSPQRKVSTIMYLGREFEFCFRTQTTTCAGSGSRCGTGPVYQASASYSHRLHNHSRHTTQQLRG